MRRLSLFTCIVLIGLTTLAAGPEDVVGEWQLTMDIGGREVEPVIVIEQREGTLAGTWRGMRGDAELQEVTFVDGVLSFHFDRETPRGTVSMSFEGTVDGERLAGQLSGPQRSFPADGVRATEDETTEGQE